MTSCPERSNLVLRHIPGTVEVLTQDGVIGFLGHGTLPALMKGSQVVLNEANDSLLWCAARSDGEEHVRVSHEVGIHLQQGALLQDEGREHHLEQSGCRDRIKQLDSK